MSNPFKKKIQEKMVKKANPGNLGNLSDLLAFKRLAHQRSAEMAKNAASTFPENKDSNFSGENDNLSTITTQNNSSNPLIIKELCVKTSRCSTCTHGSLPPSHPPCADCSNLYRDASANLSLPKETRDKILKGINPRTDKPFYNYFVDEARNPGTTTADIHAAEESQKINPKDMPETADALNMDSKERSANSSKENKQDKSSLPANDQNSKKIYGDFEVDETGHIKISSEQIKNITPAFYKTAALTYTGTNEILKIASGKEISKLGHKKLALELYKTQRLIKGFEKKAAQSSPQCAQCKHFDVNNIDEPCVSCIFGNMGGISTNFVFTQVEARQKKAIDEKINELKQKEYELLMREQQLQQAETEAYNQQLAQQNGMMTGQQEMPVDRQAAQETGSTEGQPEQEQMSPEEMQALQAMQQQTEQDQMQPEQQMAEQPRQPVELSNNVSQEQMLPEDGEEEIPSYDDYLGLQEAANQNNPEDEGEEGDEELSPEEEQLLHNILQAKENLEAQDIENEDYVSPSDYDNEDVYYDEQPNAGEEGIDDNDIDESEVAEDEDVNDEDYDDEIDQGSADEVNENMRNMLIPESLEENSIPSERQALMNEAKEQQEGSAIDEPEYDETPEEGSNEALKQMIMNEMANRQMSAPENEEDSEYEGEESDEGDELEGLPGHEETEIPEEEAVEESGEPTDVKQMILNALRKRNLSSEEEPEVEEAPEGMAEDISGLQASPELEGEETETTGDPVADTALELQELADHNIEVNEAIKDKAEELLAARAAETGELEGEESDESGEEGIVGDNDADGAEDTDVSDADFAQLAKSPASEEKTAALRNYIMSRLS